MAKSTKTSPLLWGMKNMPLLPKGNRLEFHTRPYLVAIYDDEHPWIRVQKAAQCGLTVCGIIKSFWFADMYNASIIYTFPTSRDVQKFTRTRINPMLEINKLTSPEDLPQNTFEVKQFRKSFIYFRGTKSELEALSVDADMLVHDERDKGSPDRYDEYRGRLYASRYKIELDFSTPTFHNYGIHALFEESDQHEWFIKCSHCGRRMVLGMENIREDKYVCLFCEGEITNEDRLNGVWAPKYPSRKMRGYHISQFCSIYFSPADVIEEFTHRKPRHFANLVLGQPYEGESTGLSRTVMLENCFTDPFDHADSGRVCGMGVDQGDVLHVVVGRFEHPVFKVLHVEKTTDFDRLPQLMVQYGVSRCVIDALPNKHSARAFQAKFPRQVRLAYYKDMEAEVKEQRDFILIDRTESIDTVVNTVYGGGLQLYSRNEGIEELISHCCNVKRIVEEDEDDGSQRYVWIKTGADHYLHALNYMLVALSGYGAPKFLPSPKKVVGGERDFTSNFAGRGDRASPMRVLPKIPKDMPRGDERPRRPDL